MARRGYIFVDPGSALFPQQSAEKIIGGAQEAISHIRKTRQFRIEEISFNLESLDSADCSSGVLYRQVVEPGGAEDVRFVFTQNEPSLDYIKKTFSDNLLLVCAFESKSGENVLRASGNANVVLLQLRATYIARFIQDLLIDITLANFFAKTSGPVSEVLERHSYRGLYREKVRFFRGLQPRTWLHCDRDAAYAPISSLVPAEGVASEDRAQEIFARWAEFVDSLTIQSRPEAREVTLDQTSLRSIGKLGGQLNVRKIMQAISGYPAGSYLLVIQRKASTPRKSPSVRRSLRHFFGPYSRINSFRILPASTAPDDRLLLAQLERTKFVAIIEVKLAS